EAGAHRLGAGQVPLRLHDRGRDGEAAVRPLLHKEPVDRLRPDDRPRHREGDSVRKGRQVIRPADTQHADPWHANDDTQFMTVARNVSTRYLAIGLDALIGLMLLPFNVRHLGQSAYGLWMLTASMMAYFSVLDIGFRRLV